MSDPERARPVQHGDRRHSAPDRPRPARGLRNARPHGRDRRHLSQAPRPSAADTTAVRMWCRRLGRAFFAGALIAILVVQTPIAALAQTLVVGSKYYTEQLLMAEMTSQLLTAKGLSVE